MTIERCFKGSNKIVKRFLGKNFQSRQKWPPKMALIRGNGGLDIRFHVRNPENVHPWAEPRVLAYFVKSRSGALAVASCKNQKQEVKVIWQKAPHGGLIPRLEVTPGGRKLYDWIPGVGFPISVP